MTDQNTYNRLLIEEFRANRGKSGGPMEGRPLLLLTTTGAKSGQLHTTPMMYIPDGDRLLVIASNAGAPIHPDWYRNLVAYPEVTIEVGNEIFEAIAIVTEGWSGKGCGFGPIESNKGAGMRLGRGFNASVFMWVLSIAIPGFQSSQVI